MQPVALITGAGRGIGRATAIELSKQNYNLALVSRTAADLEETASLAGRGSAIVGDVSSMEDVARIVQRALSEFGRVDALVHAAGIAPLLPLESMLPEQWRATIDTNLSAIFYFWKHLWPVWKKQGSGVVVNISSYAARDPFPGFAAYGAAKAAVNSIGLSLGREGEPANVRVHTVAPAATETAMLRGLLTREQYPEQNTLAPEDVARVIAQCVSGDLRYTSGEVIYVHRKF